MAVDLQVPDGDPLLAQTQLLHDPPAGAVAGHDGDLDSVQAEVLEREAQDRRRGLRCEALTGHGLIDPVADKGILERASLDRRQGDLAHEPLPHEDPEPVARCPSGARVLAPRTGRRSWHGPQG